MITTDATLEDWLHCQLDKGMFSDEMAVTYPPEGHVIRSVFAPMSAVRGMAGERGKVRVVVVRRMGKIFALLPSSDQDMVPVTEEDVSESP